MVCPDQQLPAGVRQLLMSDLHLTSQCIGKGAYGKCYVANIAHLQVCAKVFRSNDSFTNEVFMLSLCCHENLPWIYGIVVSESKILVMSFHAIDGMACSLHRFIHAEHSRDGIPELSSSHCKTILTGVASGVGCIHSKQILHNDIKCDNVILQSVPLHGLKGILIDFGKACL